MACHNEPEKTHYFFFAPIMANIQLKTQNMGNKKYKHIAGKTVYPPEMNFSKNIYNGIILIRMGILIKISTNIFFR